MIQQRSAHRNVTHGSMNIAGDALPAWYMVARLVILMIMHEQSGGIFTMRLPYMIQLLLITSWCGYKTCPRERAETS